MKQIVITSMCVYVQTDFQCVAKNRIPLHSYKLKKNANNLNWLEINKFSRQFACYIVWKQFNIPFSAFTKKIEATKVVRFIPSEVRSFMLKTYLSFHSRNMALNLNMKNLKREKINSGFLIFHIIVKRLRQFQIVFQWKEI